MWWSHQSVLVLQPTDEQHTQDAAAAAADVVVVGLKGRAMTTAKLSSSRSQLLHIFATNQTQPLFFAAQVAYVDTPISQGKAAICLRIRRRFTNNVRSVAREIIPYGPFSTHTLALQPADLVTGQTATQNSLFLPSGGRTHRQYSSHRPTERWPRWVGLSGLNKHGMVDSTQAVY